MITYRLTKDVTAHTSGGGTIHLLEGTILTPDSIEYQTDPDWCSMRTPDLTDESVLIHQDDLDEVR